MRGARGRRRARLAAAALASGALAVPRARAGAQAGYAALGDTLRFREVTRADIRVVAGGVEVPVRGDHEATVAVVRYPGDTARAWYEALAIGTTGPSGTQRPATDAALRAPFRLRFDARGRVALVQAPPFPEAFAGVTDLARQFDDFFPRLPAGPLRVGAMWTDTATLADSTAERSLRRRAVARYRVERDTVADGRAAVVVHLTQEITSDAEGPVPGQPARAATALAGTEDGYFVFAPAAGRLLARRREGRLEGDVTVRGAGMETRFRQRYGYTSRIEAVRSQAVR